MSDEEKTTTESAIDAGSSAEKPVDPEETSGGAGESTDDKKTTTETKDEEKSSGETVPKEQHTELESKFGEQGKELGEYRDFFNDTLPLMEKLDKDPELVKAIVGGKITSELVKATLEGKVSTEDAKTTTEAHKEVKKDLGKEGYKQTSPEEINKLVETKAKEIIGKESQRIEKKFSKDLSEDRQMREVGDKVKSFVDNTKDWPEYAVDVNKYIDKHPEITDLKVAYDAVKGIALQKRYKTEENDRIIKAQKELAANAGGGQSKSTAVIEDQKIVDQLIAKGPGHSKF